MQPGKDTGLGDIRPGDQTGRHLMVCACLVVMGSCTHAQNAALAMGQCKCMQQMTGMRTVEHFYWAPF